MKRYKMMKQVPVAALWALTAIPVSFLPAYYLTGTSAGTFTLMAITTIALGAIITGNIRGRRNRNKQDLQTHFLPARNLPELQEAIATYRYYSDENMPGKVKGHIDTRLAAYYQSAIEYLAQRADGFDDQRQRLIGLKAVQELEASWAGDMLDIALQTVSNFEQANEVAAWLLGANEDLGLEGR